MTTSEKSVHEAAAAAAAAKKNADAECIPCMKKRFKSASRVRAHAQKGYSILTKSIVFAFIYIRYLCIVAHEMYGTLRGVHETQMGKYAWAGTRMKYDTQQSIISNRFIQLVFKVKRQISSDNKINNARCQ